MNRKLKNFIMIALDLLAINISFILAFFIRFDGIISETIYTYVFFKLYLDNIVIISVSKILVFVFFGLYKNLWKYASVRELFLIVAASLIGNATVMSIMFFLKNYIPVSVYMLVFLFEVLLIGGLRFAYRGYSSYRSGRMFSRNCVDAKNTLIVGGGDAGAILIKELQKNITPNNIAVAIVDDDKRKIGSTILGVPIVGTRDKIEEICEKKSISEIIIAMPSAPKKEIRRIIEICSKTGAKLKIIPGVYELIEGKINLKEVRDVNIEDLLGRDPVNFDMAAISGYLNNKVVMVTGGGGSIGSELCRQISNFGPKKLIILDNYENNAYDIQNELLKKNPKLNLVVSIASVRERTRLEKIFEENLPQVIFHAAAHKHVPLMENNPSEAIKNNVMGTENVSYCADKYGCERFVLISTDKAVNPTNIMGASKRIAEKVIQLKNKASNTEFVAVRFGNVLGSNGSVIPLFKKQIAEGGPVTVTHKDIIRYFMTIPEAVQLVIQAGAMANGGEIFVLDMDEPVKILDLAHNLIRLSGYEPYTDIDIKFVGLRPGEKLFEELLLDSEGLKDTKHKKIFVENTVDSEVLHLNRQLKKLYSFIEKDDIKLVNVIKEIVPTYNPNNFKFKA